MHTFPTDGHGLIRRSAVLAEAGSDRFLAAAHRRKELIRLAPGVFLPVGAVSRDGRGRDELYRLRSIAVATSTRRSLGDPLSHDAAAALHRLPTLRPDRARVHFISSGGSGGRIGKLSHLHAAPLPDSDVVEVDGVAVTSLVRTACDIASRSDFAGALVVFDAVLRRGVTRDALYDVLTAHRRRGIFPARRALKYASAKSESVGESWSRGQMIAADLPIPDLQTAFVDDQGSMIVDFSWPGGVVAEFDGVDKYIRYLADGETVADAVIREKRREDRLRDLGLLVIRWIWADLVDGRMLRRLTPRLTGHR